MWSYRCGKDNLTDRTFDENKAFEGDLPVELECNPNGVEVCLVFSTSSPLLNSLFEIGDGNVSEKVVRKTSLLYYRVIFCRDPSLSRVCEWIANVCVRVWWDDYGKKPIKCVCVWQSLTVLKMVNIGANFTEHVKIFSVVLNAHKIRASRAFVRFSLMIIVLLHGTYDLRF